MKKTGLIVCRAKNMVIGNNNNAMPGWRLLDDMKFFTDMTKGNPVIMGRKNYESIPEKYRPLPNRTNIVITHQTDWNPGNPDIKIAHSLWEALGIAEQAPGEIIWNIGGAEIYALGMGSLKIDILCVSEVDADFEGNIYCPDLEEQKHYIRTDRQSFPVSERNSHPFTISKYHLDK